MKIGIIGAGIMGLTLGFRLSNAGYNVHIFESGDQPGGLSTWFNYGSFVWDKYYHVILKQDHDLLKLIQELEINDKLQWRNTKTGFLWQKQLISMSSYGEFLHFPALNFLEKLRLGGGILYSRYWQNQDKLEGISAADWLKRIFGKAVFSTIWEPLLESKFGALKEKVPATLLQATINRYYGTRSKADGRESMGYLKSGGLRVLIEKLINKITEKGSVIHCHEKALNITEENSNILLETEQGSYKFDKLISTIPSVLLNKLMPSFPTRTNSSNAPAFLGVIRLALILNRSLSPYYVTNLIDKGLPYTGIIELSRVVDKEEFGNHHLVMIPKYDLPESNWFNLNDLEIKNRFLEGLKKTWNQIENHVLQTFVHREKIVQAVWINGMPHREILTNKKGNILSFNAELTGTDNLNNNAIIRVANQMAEKLIIDDGK